MNEDADEDELTLLGLVRHSLMNRSLLLGAGVDKMCHLLIILLNRAFDSPLASKFACLAALNKVRIVWKRIITSIISSSATLFQCDSDLIFRDFRLSCKCAETLQTRPIPLV